MYPELFRIPWIDYPISTFGLMMALGFLAAAWITARRMEEEGFDPDITYTIMVYIVLGGIGGSKLYFAVDTWMRDEGPFLGLLLSRGGITWYGGLIGGVAVGALGCRRHGIPVVTFMNCAASATAVGQALGRIGCFLVGDDYGRPTDLAWGVAFPEGAPPTHVAVHPTQLYEVAWLLPIAAFLWWRRKRSPFVFGEYLALNGLGRIAIEHWRINPELALGLTQPQWIGLALILVGSGGWIIERRRARVEA
jgi:phosphatidylglycerol:prolipoprotein diacylglycerol transferase